MNDQDQKCCSSPFIAILLIGISVAIFFIWQISAASQQGKALQGTLQQFKTTVESQTEVVEKSKQVQSSLERLVLDVMELANSGDEDAKAVIAKYGVKKQDAAPAAAPAK